MADKARPWPTAGATLTLEERLAFKIADSDASQNYVVGVAIFNTPPTNDSSDTQKLLVVKRAATEDTFPNSWEIPGGHIESGETIATVIARETAEETGLIVDRVIGEFEQMRWVSRSEGRVSVQFNYVVVTKDSKKQVILNPEEHSEYRWIVKSDIDDLAMTPEMNKVLHDAFTHVQSLA